MELGPPIREVSSFQRVLCMELGPEDVSLLERCPHFRGCYVQASVKLGREDVSLLEVSSFQRDLLHMHIHTSGTGVMLRSASNFLSMSCRSGERVTSFGSTCKAKKHGVFRILYVSINAQLTTSAGFLVPGALAESMAPIL